MKKFTTTTPAQLIALGKRLAKTHAQDRIFLLSGPLGAGKTTLTKGLAAGFGANPDTITSPTFTLIHQIPLQDNVFKKLQHIDLYRIKTKAELLPLDIPELLTDTTQRIVIEWAEKFPILTKNLPHVQIRITISGTSRTIHVSQ